MVQDLDDAVRALRNGIDAKRRDTLSLPFDEVERRNWFYWPAPRMGLPLGALDGEARQLVFRVVTALVDTVTLAKVMTIIGLEAVLAELEGQGLSSRRRPNQSLPRDPSAYYTTLFGDPDGDGPWGVRFEGHHVSIHATIVNGALAPTPLFLGANPAVVERGGHVVTRPLGEEEDVARALLDALPGAARRHAVIADLAPSDIVTTNTPRVDRDLDLDQGVAGADARGDAAVLLERLVDLHVQRTRAGAVASPDLRSVRFAWAGDFERGRPHYYRLSAPHFLVEYDNTQNDANHAHSVWRDPEGDFGDDLLRGHHAAEH
ncbi:MAG: DUF3500 domain-containing protein [Actinobacteria bacterium]|nr:DUF3500 domain-containing protein [Actinomycetota bacterium]